MNKKIMTEKPYSYSNDNNSVLINGTDIPQDWCNVLWSEQGYIGRFTQAGHGESYYIDEKANMCELNSNEIRYIYLRDDDANVSWNIGESPMMEEVDGFLCEHNIAFTKIQSKKQGIQASVRYIIPYEGYHEIWTIKLKNESTEVKNLSMFSVVNFHLEGFEYPRHHEVHRVLNAGFDNALNGVFCKTDHPYAPHNRYNAFISASELVFASDAHLKKFTGGTGSFARPKMLLSGKDCTNTRRTCYDVGGVIQNKITLKPGEEKEIHIAYGLTTSLDDAIKISKETFEKGKVETVLEETANKFQAKYSTIGCETPEIRINQLMNNWVKKQVDFCIVGKKGVRDNAQIASALLMYRPEKAKEEILEIMRHQYKAGNAVVTWLPLDEVRYSDQPFWIVWVVTELLKETGEFDLLDKVIEYQDGGEGTVYEHLKAGINRLLEDRGKNGLVKIFFADWNDALNITDDPEAESVMLTQQFCLALKELESLAILIGDKEYAKYLNDNYLMMKDLLNKNAWDGEWYSRALSEKGSIGSKTSSGSNIYLNSQIWAMLSEVYREEDKSKILEAIGGMEHDFGYPINLPANTEFSPHSGRMSIMAPGLFENGGVYCHASAFKVMMDGKLGRGDEAVKTLKKIIPDNEKNPYTQSETEPYVFTNCYATNEDAYGKADRSWITGTSAWCMKGIYEGVLGIYKDYEGLRIAPAIPDSWDFARAKRTYRGSVYEIEYKKSTNGEKYIEVNGTRIEGNILPVGEKGQVVKVLVSF